MRMAARNKAVSKEQIANFQSLPAPVGGWNAYDSLAAMGENYAITLDNWYPSQAYCETRGGTVTHATGMTGNGKTLAVWNGITGTTKMFCATASGVYDVSAAGAVGSAVAARTSGKHQTIVFTNGAINYLIMVNGVDKPLYYDGSTWVAVDGASTPPLTGLGSYTTNNIVNVTSHKGRLFYILNNQMSFWYLPVSSAGGALTEFPLEGVGKKGGYLMAAESWSVDAGDGPDDRMVFVTSEGEVIVYQGTDPTSFSLVGVYTLAEPLGRKCIFKYGNELVILTRQGAYPLTALFNMSGLDLGKAATLIIQKEFNRSASQYGSNYGWKCVFYPNKSAVLVNIPVAEDGIHYQYVLNTITNAWCRFVGWDAEDFEVFNDELYYTDGTVTKKAWTGNSDDGSNIECIGKTAFSHFESRGQQKKFKLFRHILETTGTIDFLAGLDIDYQDTDISGVNSAKISSSSLWGTALWGTALWGSEAYSQIKQWKTPVNYPGFCAASKIKIATNAVNVRWISTDYSFEVGNGF